MSVPDDAELVLRIISDYPTGNSGEATVVRPYVEKISGFEVSQLDEAVELLRRNGDVVALPKGAWATLSPTIQGRALVNPTIARNADFLLDWIGSLSGFPVIAGNDLKSRVDGLPAQKRWAVDFLESRGDIIRAGEGFALTAVGRKRKERQRDAPIGQTDDYSVEGALPLSLVANAFLRDRAIRSINDAIEALMAFEGRGIERDLIADYVIGDLKKIVQLLNLESDSVSEILRARGDVNVAVSYVERAKSVFERHGFDYMVGLLSSATVAIGQALVSQI